MKMNRILIILLIMIILLYFGTCTNFTIKI